MHFYYKLFKRWCWFLRILMSLEIETCIKITFNFYDLKMLKCVRSVKNAHFSTIAKYCKFLMPSCVSGDVRLIVFFRENTASKQPKTHLTIINNPRNVLLMNSIWAHLNLNSIFFFLFYSPFLKNYWSFLFVKC